MLLLLSEILLTQHVNSYILYYEVQMSIVWYVVCKNQ